MLRPSGFVGVHVEVAYKDSPPVTKFVFLKCDLSGELGALEGLAMSDQYSLLGRCTAAKRSSDRAGRVKRRMVTRSLSKTGLRNADEKPEKNRFLSCSFQRKSGNPSWVAD